MEAVFLCHVVDEGKVAERIQLVRVEGGVSLSLSRTIVSFSNTCVQVSYSTQTPTEIMLFKYDFNTSDTHPNDKISDTQEHMEK